jgi:hypothetical protein
VNEFWEDLKWRMRCTLIDSLRMWTVVLVNVIWVPIAVYLFFWFLGQ